MKRLFGFIGSAALITLALSTVPACDDDDDNPINPNPTTGTVSGTVTFDGTWPSTGDVQVSIYSTLQPPLYVPTGPPDAFTDPIAGSPATYDYEFSGLEFGTYAGILVSWRDPVNPSGAQLLGMYWTYVDSVGIYDSGPFDGAPKPPYPTPVTVDASNAVRDNLDIRADLDLSQ